MTVLIIEHLNVSELPTEWARRLNVRAEQTVRVRIETESEAADLALAQGSYKTDDPSYGIWKDRQDIGDVDTYVRRLRTARHGGG